MKTAGRLLVVDDDKAILRSVEMLLESRFEKILTLSNPNLIRENLQSFHPDIILLDMNFTAGRSTGNEGLFWLKEIKKHSEEIVVILMTAYGDIDLAVKGMKEGAMDFVVKPWNNEKLISTLQAAWRYRTSQNKVKNLSKQKESLSAELNKTNHEIISESPEMQELLNVVEKVAQTAANVLITGENGTGKELIARKLHNLSPRSNAPMISVDLTTFNPGLFESELFGHTEGAFTDAKKDRTGRFEMADGGTLFLDEIGNLPMEMQAKILTVLQNREITPVGAVQPKPIDIRLICATNKDINQEISRGTFREDLFYRINTIQIELPPLRNRGNDINLLAQYYLNHYRMKYGKPDLTITSDALNKIKSYDWPGNVRELRHTIEKAVILNEAKKIDAGDFYLNTKHDKQNGRDWPLTFDEIEKKAINRALNNNKGKLTDAANELGITRQTLYNKLKKYNISNE